MVVTQTAYTTYSCVLKWLLTGNISLKQSSKDTSLTSCSSISLYRLAHLLEIPGLVQYALDTIQQQLTPHKAAALLFSDLSVTYEGVQKLALSYVLSNWSQVRSTESMKKAKELSQGERAEEFGPIAMELLMAME